MSDSKAQDGRAKVAVTAEILSTIRERHPHLKPSAMDRRLWVACPSHHGFPSFMLHFDSTCYSAEHFGEGAYSVGACRAERLVRQIVESFQ